MNVKAEVYKKFLEENQINWGEITEIEETVPEEQKMHPVVYRSAIGVNGQNLPTMLVIDDSMYVMLQIRVAAGVVKEANKQAVLEHLNALNENFNVFKYYTDAAGNIIIESCIPSANEPFVPAIIHYVIEVIAKHLQEEYPNLMKVVWSN